MSTSHHPHDPHSLGAHSLPPPGPHLPPPQGQRFLMNEPGSELQIPSRDGFPSGYLMLSPQRKQCVASGDLGPPCASPLSWGSHLPLDLSSCLKPQASLGLPSLVSLTPFSCLHLSASPGLSIRSLEHLQLSPHCLPPGKHILP